MRGGDASDVRSERQTLRPRELCRSLERLVRVNGTVAPRVLRRLALSLAMLSGCPRVPARSAEPTTCRYRIDLEGDACTAVEFRWTHTSDSLTRLDSVERYAVAPDAGMVCGQPQACTGPPTRCSQLDQRGFTIEHGEGCNIKVMPRAWGACELRFWCWRPGGISEGWTVVPTRAAARVGPAIVRCHCD